VKVLFNFKMKNAKSKYYDKLSQYSKIQIDRKWVYGRANSHRSQLSVRSIRFSDRQKNWIKGNQFVCLASKRIAHVVSSTRFNDRQTNLTRQDGSHPMCGRQTTTEFAELLGSNDSIAVYPCCSRSHEMGAGFGA